MKLELDEKQILLLILILIAIPTLAGALTTGIGWDEAAHANSALFTYNFIKYWISNPTFSFQKIMEFAVEYHSHYKFFTAFAVYPPLDMIISSITYLLLGTSLLATRLPTVLQSLVLLYFVFKLSKLFDDDKLFPFITILFLAFHPAYFDQSTRNHLEIMVALFFVTTVYFFVKFLRTENLKYMYFTAISLGLSLITKPMTPLLLLALFFTLLLEKKLYLSKKYPKELLKASLIFILVSTPIILQVGVLYSQGVSDIFLKKWTSTAGMSTDKWIYGWLPSFEVDKPVFASSVHIYLEQGGQLSEFQEFTKNLSTFLFQWYLIPFFILGLYNSVRRNREIDKVFVLIPLVFLYIFTVKVHANSLKHLMPAIPFVVMFACKGLVDFSEYSAVKRFKIPLVGLLLIFSLFQTYGYYKSIQINYSTNSNYDEAARYLIGLVKEPTTVLTTYGQMQMLAFARLDTGRKIYCMYAPNKKSEWAKAIDGDFSYYESYGFWKSFGVSHPRPKYAIIHEQRLKSKRYDYSLDYFNSQPERFELLRVLDGKVPGDRTLIYKIK